MGRKDGKVVVVTGAARGLGEADARLLAAESARVILMDIDEVAGAATAAAIGGTAIGGLGYPIDVARAVLFLLSDETPYINGVALSVDNATAVS